MFDFRAIGSSSKGNCYVLSAGSETLLIEAGMPLKKILIALDFNLNNVCGCLLTHEHGDHSKAVVDIMRCGIDVYASAGTLKAVSAFGHRAIPIRAKQSIAIGEFKVLPFPVEHDAAEPLGFLIQHEEFGKFLFATDTYYIRYVFPNLNYIAIECNYSEELLRKNIEYGRINPVMEKRLLKSHMSVENLTKMLKKNDLNNLRRIFLLHLSDANSSAAGFKKMIEETAGVPVEVL